MRRTATKEFDIQEGSTTNSWYLIDVFFHGVHVDSFLCRTMKEAQEQFRQAGYKIKENT